MAEYRVGTLLRAAAPKSNRTDRISPTSLHGSGHRKTMYSNNLARQDSTGRIMTVEQKYHLTPSKRISRWERDTDCGARSAESHDHLYIWRQVWIEDLDSADRSRTSRSVSIVYSRRVSWCSIVPSPLG